MAKRKEAAKEKPLALTEETLEAAAESLPATVYAPNERERATAEAFQARRAARPVFPKIKLEQSSAGGVANISSEHSDQLLAASMQVSAFGLGSVQEFHSLLKDVLEFTQRADGSGIDETAANEALALVVGIGPANTVESMLAVQMTAVHHATMIAARQLNISKTLEQKSVHTKALNNLSRTFASQAEALKKLRGSGEQRVVVEHKHYHLEAGAISPGSQAVIGDVHGKGAGV